MSTTPSCGGININHEAAIGFQTINLNSDDENDNNGHMLKPPAGASRATLQFISTTGIVGVPQSKPIARITEFPQSNNFTTNESTATGTSFYTFDYMFYYITGIKNLIQTRIKKATGLDSSVIVYVEIQYHK